MTAVYRFEVRGDYPPKKTTDTSMFCHRSEARLVARLRHAAGQAIEDRPPLRANVKLTLVVYGPPSHGRQTGDLDNQVSGVLDALQAASKSTPWAEQACWGEAELAGVLPDRPIGLLDDGAVVEIAAKRVEDSATPWYEVVLEGEP